MTINVRYDYKCKPSAEKWYFVKANHSPKTMRRLIHWSGIWIPNCTSFAAQKNIQQTYFSLISCTLMASSSGKGNHILFFIEPLTTFSFFILTSVFNSQYTLDMSPLVQHDETWKNWYVPFYQDLLALLMHSSNSFSCSLISLGACWVLKLNTEVLRLSILRYAWPQIFCHSSGLVDNNFARIFVP